MGPSRAPTGSPSPPTESPTDAPTPPSRAPTGVPTGSPTPPTESPTDAPTAPTKAPTNAPTVVGPDGTVDPLSCVGDSSKPLQLYRQNDAYMLKSLDLSSGQYQSMWSLPMDTRTMHNGISYDGYTGMYSDIDAAAVSPRDKKAYAVMKGVEGGSSAEASYLVRFDSNTVHFVAPTKSWTWMACTDSSGDYLYVQGGVSVSGSNGAIAGPLYKIGTPDALIGYRSVTGLNNAGVTDSTSILICLLYTSPSPRDGLLSRMPSSA